MKNDNYVVMYCNNCIGTFTTLKNAIEFINNCKNNDFYLQKNEFSIHIKMSEFIGG